VFPLRYGVIKGFPFQDLIEMSKDHLDLIIQAAVDLEEGTIYCCRLQIIFPIPEKYFKCPSDLIPWLVIEFDPVFLPERKKIGLITGGTRLLKEDHLAAANADRARLIIGTWKDARHFKE